MMLFNKAHIYEIEKYIKASQVLSTLIVECEKSLFGDRERMGKWSGVGF